MEVEVLTAKDIAKMLGVCPRYVSEKLSMQEGFPPRLAIPARKRWLKQDIIGWLEKARIDGSNHA